MEPHVWGELRGLGRHPVRDEPEVQAEPGPDGVVLFTVTQNLGQLDSAGQCSTLRMSDKGHMLTRRFWAPPWGFQCRMLDNMKHTVVNICV